MNEKIKLIIVIIVFVIALVFANNILNNNADNNIDEVNNKNQISNSVENVEKSNEVENKIEDTNPPNENSVSADLEDTEKLGQVFEVTEEDFEEMVLKSKEKVLVEFYADWCGPCKTLSPILQKIAKENLDLKVVKINVDESPNLALKYGANYIPLLVVFENGEEVNHAVGALPKKDILELVK